MSNPLPPLNLSAVALSVLQTRSAAAGGAVRGEAAKPAPPALLRPSSDVLVPRLDQGAGAAIPRGRLLDIVV